MRGAGVSGLSRKVGPWPLQAWGGGVFNRTFMRGTGVSVLSQDLSKHRCRGGRQVAKL